MDRASPLCGLKRDNKRGTIRYDTSVSATFAHKQHAPVQVTGPVTGPSDRSQSGPQGAVPDAAHTNYVVTGRKRLLPIYYLTAEERTSKRRPQCAQAMGLTHETDCKCWHNGPL